jgi:AcrR family transcriptional regulator
MEAVATATVSRAGKRVRGAATREALLDAAEGLIADYGFHAPSHRMIAGAAKTHVALVNYHFSSKEMLFEAAIERRARRLNEEWRAGIVRARTRRSPSVENILDTWWRPFAALDNDSDPAWNNYLCAIARLATAADGEVWHQRYFGTADRDFLALLGESLPKVKRDDIEAGFRYARSLFGEVLLHRCGKAGGTCRPPGFREDDIGRLIRYLSCGLRGMTGSVAIAAD